jgi:hypothetical protein
MLSSLHLAAVRKSRRGRRSYIQVTRLRAPKPIDYVNAAFEGKSLFDLPHHATISSSGRV